MYGKEGFGKCFFWVVWVIIVLEFEVVDFWDEVIGGLVKDKFGRNCVFDETWVEYGFVGV